MRIVFILTPATCRYDAGWYQCKGEACCKKNGFMNPYKES